ncbi:hypothetical protein EYC84_006357 [Monilinia fructicola]|uniref:Uncharacterized protein n=1 Tax=Monilinia fructicola TaxID=38448 RepID=A0A5M9K339_MONFR|nr:hypothetical protein EYC84_006357 [Monilinia fructicola]
MLIFHAASSRLAIIFAKYRILKLLGVVSSESRLLFLRTPYHQVTREYRPALLLLSMPPGLVKHGGFP